MAKCRKGHGEYTGNECPLCKRIKRHGNQELSTEQSINRWRNFSNNTKWCILYVKNFGKIIKKFPEVKIISDTCNPLSKGICVTDGLVLSINDVEFFDTINHEASYQEPYRSTKHTIPSNKVLGSDEL